ncbi:zinc finger protein ush-like [Haliotis rubra]|uniref:zinc finger protein ush-like n=1 Tax=Haliotis rubra TaxID=36100 RepID=UPI001EE4EFE9|nr:zinc finger protein ush-like [Haliotis rubra]
MSRRKQSNPKPLKLSSDEPSIKTEDGGETEVSGNGETAGEASPTGSHHQGENQGETTPLSSRCIQSPASSDLDPSDSHTETPGGKVDQPNMSDIDNVQVKQEVNTDSSSPTMLQGLANQLQLPKDVLYLKRVEITMHGNTAVCWVVCCAIPLQAGSSLGPFQGEVTSADKVRVGDLILQFSGKTEPILVNVTAQSGAWLALLRTATNNAVKNTCVHLEGDRIWCEVVSDLEEGSELIGSFLYHAENESPSQSSSPVPALPPPPVQEEEPVKPEPPPAPPSKRSRSPTNHAALIYGCPFCSVRFSSPRTLQGHLAYYCSKKPPDLGEKTAREGEGSGRNADENDTDEDSKAEISVTVDEDEKSKLKRPLETDGPSYKQDQDSPPTKVSKMGQTFQCPHCSYTADKLSSLNRHRRIHNRPSDDSDEVGNVPVPLSETYCKDCNIQFSSLSTFKGHKEFYCNKRNGSDVSETPKKESWEDKMGAESTSSHSSPTSQPSEPHRNIFLPSGPLMTQTVISAVSSAAVIPGQTAVIFAAPVMATSDMGITMPTVIVQPVIAPPPVSSTSTALKEPSPSPTKVPTEAHQKSKSAALCSEKPLDLSKKKDDSPEKEKSPNKILNMAKDSLKLITSQAILKEFPSLIECKSPPLTSPKSVTSNHSRSPHESSRSPQLVSRSKSPHNTSPSLSSRSRSPEHIRHRTSPYLQGLTPHFLPMSVAGVAAQAVATLQPPTAVATISKCADCNIVFYKHENYLIHKEHYCSGKKAKFSTPPESESLRSPKSSPDSGSPMHTEVLSSNSDQQKEAEAEMDSSEDIYYRFFCVPCKIKFSSASTLKAHKEFYCPHGKDSGHSIVIQASECQQESPTPKTPVTPEIVDFRCDRCESVFTTSRLLKLHLCSGESTSMPLFRCPHCDYVTQTDTRLSDHMKVHAPTRAFRCTVCGYRGNTVRGMRMHGKSHIDNGEEFTDDSMIEYEEPALMPIQTNGQTSHGPVDMEAELIRLKNEPYKRRRSRKSFEKTEYILSPGSLQQTQHCPVCREAFPNLKFLNVHMRIHEMALKYQQDLLKCHKCSYLAKSKEDLIFHMKDIHTPPQSSPSPTSPKKSPTPEQRPPSQERTVHIKSEPIDPGFDVALEKDKDRERDLSPSSPNKENVKRENIQDRSYTPKSDGTQSVRASPFSRVSPNAHLSPLNPPTSPPIKSQPKSPMDGASNGSGHDKHSPDIFRKDISNGSGSHSIMFPSGPVFPYFLIPPSSVGTSVVSPEPTSPKTDKGPKYCKNCDISFTYPATFLAHKKYYCTAAKTSEELSPSASA